jgi:hypothetical protein
MRERDSAAWLAVGLAKRTAAMAMSVNLGLACMKEREAIEKG